MSNDKVTKEESVPVNENFSVELAIERLRNQENTINDFQKGLCEMFGFEKNSIAFFSDFKKLYESVPVEKDLVVNHNGHTSPLSECKICNPEKNLVASRPNVKDFFKTLEEAHNAYLNEPSLFNYAQALDNYIDDLVASNNADEGASVATLGSGVGNSIERQLIEALQEYNKLLSDGYNRTYSNAYVHHYRESPEIVSKGIELRARIEKLQSLLTKEQSVQESDNKKVE